MIAESRRQLRRILPIDARETVTGAHDFDRARRGWHQQKQAEND
jgi:hypothetical protein